MAPIALVLLVWRPIVKDRMLQCDLPGYADYVARVRYRLDFGGGLAQMRFLHDGFAPQDSCRSDFRQANELIDAVGAAIIRRAKARPRSCIWRAASARILS